MENTRKNENERGRYEMKGENFIKKEYFESILSTNDYAKERRAERQNLWILAKRQTAGRGTKGRSFSSQEGGLYITALLFYERFPAKDAFKIMQRAAAAVCETLAHFGVAPKIKWPNDIYANGKKICGILIENTFSGTLVSSSIVGIGLNVQNDLEEELRLIATTLQKETGKAFSVEEVEEKLFSHFFQEGIERRYASYLGWLGERAVLLMGDKSQEVTLLSVDEQGNLLVETEQGKLQVSAGEVSLKIQS